MSRWLTIIGAVVGLAASALWALSAYASPVPLVGAFAMNAETRETRQKAVNRKATKAARLSAAAAALTAISLLLSSIGSLVGGQ